MVIEQGITVEEAAYESGLTTSKKIGSEQGVIGILTKGRLNRKELTKQAITNTLIHLENPELY